MINAVLLQTMALVAIEVLPTTLMTLPAAQGGLTTSFQIYAQHLQDWGFPVPSMGADVAALALTACLAAVASLGDIAPSIEEFVSFAFKRPFIWLLSKCMLSLS